jgi:hypothetical protein
MMKKNYILYTFIFFIIAICLWVLYLRLNGKIVKETYPKIGVPELYSYSKENLKRYKNKTSKDYVFDVIIPHKFCGIIRNKNIDANDHDSRNFVIITKSYYFTLYINPDFGGIDSGLFDYSCVGDSIFKNSNSLIISVRRNNVIKNFNVSPYEEFWKDPYYNERLK